MQPLFQHSAGGVLVREGQVLLISTRGGSRWQLPKGHLERGETAEQAALREVQEETGVRGRLLEPLGQVEYDFTSLRGQVIHKRVDYFLLEYLDGSTRDYDRKEVSGAGWFDFQDALQQLTFENERGLVKQALQAI